MSIDRIRHTMEENLSEELLKKSVEHIFYEILMKSKSTDFSRWWGVGAEAPHHIHSTNEVGGYKSEALLGTIELSRKTQLLDQGIRKRISFRDQRPQEINSEATDEVGGHSLFFCKGY